MNYRLLTHFTRLGVWITTCWIRRRSYWACRGCVCVSWSERVWRGRHEIKRKRGIQRFRKRRGRNRLPPSLKPHFICSTLQSDYIGRNTCKVWNITGGLCSGLSEHITHWGLQNACNLIASGELGRCLHKMTYCYRPIQRCMAIPERQFRLL